MSFNQAFEEKIIQGAEAHIAIPAVDAHIHLVNLKADFGTPAAKKINEPLKASSKETAPEAKKAAAQEPQKAQAANEQMGNLVVEGIIDGNRLSLESSLASYLIKLQESPIFRQVAVQKNSIERIKKKDVLRFTINLGML